MHDVIHVGRQVVNHDVVHTAMYILIVMHDIRSLMQDVFHDISRHLM